MAEDVVATIERIRRLGGWYRSRGTQISEHEIRTFVVVPLLLALGWSPRQLRIEWNHLDVALFDRPYGPDATLIGLIETKRPSAGLRGARTQAIDYARTMHDWCRKGSGEGPPERPKENCAFIVVTNGFSYQVLRRPDAGWPDLSKAPPSELSERTAALTEGSVNLMGFRERNPLTPELGAAPEVFKVLTAPRLKD